MNVADWIKVYDDVLPDRFCDEWIALFEDPSSVKHPHDEDYRRCLAYRDIDKTQHFADVRSVVAECLDRYRRSSPTDVVNFVGALETPGIFRYDPDDARPNRFHEHADAWSIPTATRQLSVIAYLNDVADGGETVFPQLGIEVKPRKGTVLAFPSSFVFTHEGRVPRSGPKYIAVSWLHFSGVGHHYRCHQL